MSRPRFLLTLCCLNAIFGSLLLAQPSPATPAPLDRDTPLPYRVHWGAYTVTVASFGEIGERFCILDTHGIVLREVRANTIDSVDFPHLSGHGLADLRVIAHPLSNIIHHRRTFCFTRVGGLRNVLIMPDGFDTVCNLGHAGRRELIADTCAPLEYVADVCHACSPNLMLILGWDGRRYVIQNRRFPWLARRKARYYQWAYRAARDHPDAFVDHQIAPAIGYFANMETIGQGRRARRWLLSRMRPSVRLYFLASLPDVRSRLARMACQITMSEKHLFIVTDDGN